MINVKEKLDEGWIHCRTIIEVLGKPEEHVNEAIRAYVEDIKKDKEIIIVQEDYSELEKQEEMFSGFVEIEMLAKSIAKVVWFCFDYLPASIEIIEPEVIRYKAIDFTSFLNDLQARLHMIGIELKTKLHENAMLDKNGQQILENFIYFCLRDKDCTIDELSMFTGIKADQLLPFVYRMTEDGRIQQKEEKYSARKA